MDYYQMPKGTDFENLDACLKKYGDNFNDLSITLMDCPEGTTVFAQNMAGKRLRYSQNDGGIYLIVNDWPVHYFPLKKHDKGFMMSYVLDWEEKEMIKITKIGPDNPDFPKALYSTLTNIWDEHLVHIGFRGLIPLEFHSWKDKIDGDKYWKIKG